MARKKITLISIFDFSLYTVVENSWYILKTADSTLFHDISKGVSNVTLSLNGYAANFFFTFDRFPSVCRSVSAFEQIMISMTLIVVVV